MRRPSGRVSLSKTLKLDQPIVESDGPSEMTEEEQQGGLDGSTSLIHQQQQEALSGFIRFDLQYLFPLFTHRFSRSELRDCRLQMSNLANQWHQAVRSSPNNTTIVHAPDGDAENNNTD